MMGTLKKIDITEALIEKVAASQYRLLNGDEYADQADYIKGIWHDEAVDSLEDFNDMIDILYEIECQG